MKTRMKTNIVLFLVALLFCLFFALEAYAFRCGDEIIGDRRQQGQGAHPLRKTNAQGKGRRQKERTHEG